MKVSTLLSDKKINSFVDAETIIKLLICYYNNIHDTLVRSNSFSIKENLTYIKDYIEDNYKHDIITNKKTNKTSYKHRDVNNIKHKIIMDLFKNEHAKFCKINNYIYPEDCNTFSGPYISKNYILFYEYEKEILIVFNFIPLNYAVHNIPNYKSDIIIRDLNSYILDNVSNDNWTQYIKNKNFRKKYDEIDYKTDILPNYTFTTKIGEHKNNLSNKIEVLRVVKEVILNTDKSIKHPFYKWEIIEKSNEIYSPNFINNN